MYSEKEMMMKPHTILLTLAIIILFCNAVEGGAHLNKGILSRKTLKEERKLITTGVSPALGGFLGQISSNTDAGQINRNADSAKIEAPDAATAYTSMTATTTDSHHDISVDQYRRMIRNNGIKP
jgi:hypothetical protein